MHEDRFLIVGGGIAGLTLALALEKKGLASLVMERNKGSLSAGAGIQLSPNASRILNSLGLGTLLLKHVSRPESTWFRNWRSGKIIHKSDLGDKAETKYGAPYWQVHRADLAYVLLEATRQKPLIEFLPNCEVLKIHNGESGTFVETSLGEKKGVGIIGADGIKSTVRNEICRNKEEARFTGNVAWRCLVPADRVSEVLREPATSVWWGPGKHFVHYPVRQGALINCVCVAEKDAWTEESWTKSGDKKALNSAFASWHPIIEELIQEAHEEELYEWGLFDRPAMSTWFKGRTTLIGDACHPMLPFLAQGAAMAIEDAFILAEMIAMQTHRLEKTFEIFFHERIERVSKVQNASRRNATVFHLSGISALVRNILAPTQGQRISDYLYKFIAIDKYSAKPMIIEKGD